MTEQEIKVIAEQAAQCLYKALMENMPITIVLKSTCSDVPEYEE